MALLLNTHNQSQYRMCEKNNRPLIRLISTENI